MKNKTASECWIILRGEIDSAIDSYVPMESKGNDLLRYNNYCLSTVNTNQDRFMDYL